MTSKRRILTIVICLLLTSCGGGGAGGGSSPSGGGSSPSAGGNSSNVNLPPVANAGADRSETLRGTRVSLDGGQSRDPDGDTITYSWIIDSQPNGSNVTLSNTASDVPSFLPALPGVYTFSLSVSDSSGLSSDDTVAINMIKPDMKAIPLSQSFTDAEFDKIHDRLVIVSGKSLLIIENDDSITTVPLPFAGQAVSISPDGLFAAVGHNDARLSHIDLSRKTVLKTVTLSSDPIFDEPSRGLPNFGEVVLANNGIAYGFPQNRTHTKVYAVNFETEESTFSEGDPSSEGLVPGNSKALLRADGRVMYALRTESSSGGLAKIERLEVDGLHVENKRINDDDYFESLIDPVTHNSVPSCADMWPDVDGKVFLTQCYNLMRTTEGQHSDRFLFNYFNRPQTVIQHASASAFTRKWYIIDTGEEPGTVSHQNVSNSGSNIISVYDVDTGNELPSITLPKIGGGNSADWLAKFVFASDNSDTQWILAVDNYDTPQSFALLKSPFSSPILELTNRPPEIILDEYKSIYLGQNITLDASKSHDPENSSLSYDWSLVSEPETSNILPSGLSTDIVTFMPSVAGVYIFELQVSDGERVSPVKKVSITAFEEEEDLVFRLDAGIVDIEYSKSLDRLVYLPDTKHEVVIFNPDNFSKTMIPIQKRGYRIGISPDGYFAVVSHSGLATLIDLRSGTVIDTQETHVDQEQIIDGRDWGHIVVDHNNKVILSPYAIFESHYYSIDFTNNISVEAGRLMGGAQMRLHPTENWVYTARTLGYPDDLAKLDVSVFPAVYIGDSPYHGDYDIGENVWISEDGDELMTPGGIIFNTDSDSNKDMYYKDEVSEDIKFEWADHSTEANMWATTTHTEMFDDRILLFDDVDFTLSNSIDIAEIKTATGAHTSLANQVFYSSDGDRIYTILKSGTPLKFGTLLDQNAIQITQIDKRP